MVIRITSDSTCDLSPAIIDELNIKIIPLYLTRDGQAYRDGVEITPMDIFRHVEGGGDMYSTAAINIADYTDFFSSQLEDSDVVIHFNIGSAFSGCHQNAVAAAGSLSNVYVVDSQNLSTGQGHVVMEAGIMAKNRASVNEILTMLDDLIPRVEASFLLDRLDYMHKGGRCSSVAALGANVLKLKPCIEVIDGKMCVGKKYRGSFEKCIREYVKDRLDGRNDIVYERIFITHPKAKAEAINAARETVAQYAPEANVIETQAGCTISNHCGPNTLGVLFIRKPSLVAAAQSALTH